MPGIHNRKFTKSCKDTDGKLDLDAIICRSTHFTNHYQERADEQDPQQRTVYSNNANRKPRVFITIDVFGMSPQADSWTNTFHMSKRMEQSLNETDRRQ